MKINTHKSVFLYSKTTIWTKLKLKSVNNIPAMSKICYWHVCYSNSTNTNQSHSNSTQNKQEKRILSLLDKISSKTFAKLKLFYLISQKDNACSNFSFTFVLYQSATLLVFISYKTNWKVSSARKLFFIIL